jgi:hypothetical protein
MFKTLNRKLLALAGVGVVLLLALSTARADEPTSPQQPIPKHAEAFAAVTHDQGAPLVLYKDRGQCKNTFLAASYMKDGRVYATGCWYYDQGRKLAVITWDDDGLTTVFPSDAFTILNAAPAAKPL